MIKMPKCTNCKDKIENEKNGWWFDLPNGKKMLFCNIGCATSWCIRQLISMKSDAHKSEGE